MSYFKTIAIDQTNPGTTNGVQVNAALPAGTNVIGHVIVDSGAIAATVSGVATAAKQDTGNTSVASIDTKTPALGQALAAASVPVVLTAAQLTTLTPPSAITGYATETTLAGVLTTSDFDTKTGALTETAPATDTASSGINGRLQRIAQRISSLITALGSPFQAGGSIGNTSFAATQATASSLNAAVVGTGTAGTPAGNILTVQGVTSMTKLLVTPDANSAINLAQVGGTNTVTAGVSGTLAVGGNVATNVAIGTNPINNGAQAVSSENTAVTTSRMAQLVCDLVGKLIVLPYANPENFVSGAITSAMTSTTSTSLIAAPASGLRNYITAITVSNASTTVPTDIVIQDGSGGTTLYTLPCPIGTGTGTGTSGGHYPLPVPIRQPTTATAIFCANVTTGSNTKVSAVGYKGA